MAALTREGRPERVGWYFYDFANSAFSTTVVTVFTGPYLTSVARAAADPAGYVHPLGIPVLAGSFFPYVVSLSVFFQVLLLPLLGAIADYSHRKKPMLFLFAYAGSAATVGLYFLEGTRYLLGGGCSCWRTSASGPRWSSTTPGCPISRLRKTAIPSPPWGGRSGTSGAASSFS